MNKKLYDLMDWAEIETIVYSEHDHPEEVLGAHKVSGGILIQAFFPNAASVFVKSEEDGKLHRMSEADEAGFFAVLVAVKKVFPYTFVVKDKDGTETNYYDAYLYTDALNEKEYRSFTDGKDYKIYEKMGAHPVVVSGYGREAAFSKRKSTRKKGETSIHGTCFSVWAPNAIRVSVVGDFNAWDGRVHQMVRLGDTGVFALFIPGVEEGEIYKYEIKYSAVRSAFKSDPYGFRSELRPAEASIVTDLSGYAWKDKTWMTKRISFDVNKSPMSVYELHLGSWMQKEGENGEKGFYTYRELAPKIAEYVIEMGYTHIELMPFMEYKEDASLGYHVTGYYAVTSRYGTPEDFMYFVDTLHQKGIGVIMDWVPAYFSAAENGLTKFDGTYLYERSDSVEAMSGLCSFDYNNPQVANFLIANTIFWKEVYHIDGIRVSGVAPMLYLDFNRPAGNWTPNEFGGNENLAAVAMLRRLSEAFHKKGDGAVLIAEESSAWPLVTGDITENGLGFDLKWNMGWMHDFLSYLQIDPYFRKGNHEKLLAGML